MSRKLGRWLGGAVLLAGLLPGLAAAEEPLRVCLLTHDAPRAAQESGKGFDIDVMKAVAERLGRPFEPVWIPNPPLMTEVEETDLPLKPLARGECDAVPSVPGEGALGELDRALALSAPYYGAAFELVGAKDVAPDLAALKGKTLVVQSVSVAHRVADGLKTRVIARPTAAGQLAALDSGAADAALVWGPELGPLAHKPVAGWVAPPVLRWNEHVAVRAGDGALKEDIDRALGALREDGTIRSLLTAHGLPPHPPFDEVFSPALLAALDKAEAAPQTETVAGMASPVAQYRQDPEALKRGEGIFAGICGGYCHRLTAAAATDALFLFDCEWKHGGSDEEIFRTISQGVPDTRMVAFGEALPAEDIWKVIAYLRERANCSKEPD